MNYSQALKYLEQLETYGIKLGLEQVSELLERSGNPQNSLKFIHVAGTNGKGSLCAMLYNALRGAGFKTGLYSSPHLVSPRERFRLDGKGITEAEFSEIVEFLKPCAEKMRAEGRCPTYFEFTTVMAILFFKNKSANFTIWETGMGGRFDATNVVLPELSAISSISLDHEQFLGNSIESVSFEKAGIIKPNTPVFCGDLHPEALDVIAKVAKDKSAPLCDIRDSDLEWMEDGAGGDICFLPNGMQMAPPITGVPQKGNFMLAYEIIRFLAREHNFSIEKAVEGLAKTKWPARFQILPDGKILDGAHNPEAIQALVKTAQKIYPGRNFQIVYGALADKNAESAMRSLDLIASKFIFVPVKGSRKSYSAIELQKIAEGVICTKNKAETADSAGDAMKMTGSEPTIICGSLYLAGEVLSMYFGENEIIDL